MKTNTKQQIGVTLSMLLAGLIIILFDSLVWGADFDYSIGVTKGMNEGKLTVGTNEPSLGDAKDTDYPISFVSRVIYSKYSFKPVAEFTYKQSKYDVSTSRAIITLDPREYSLRLGLIKEIYGIELIALAGYTYYEGNLQVFEDGVGAHQNGKIPNSRHTPSARLAIGKYIPLSNGFSLGFETGIEYYFLPRNYNACMKFEPNQLEPYLGLNLRF